MTACGVQNLLRKYVLIQRQAGNFIWFYFWMQGEDVSFFCSDIQLVHSCPNFFLPQAVILLYFGLCNSDKLCPALTKAPCSIFSCLHLPLFQLCFPSCCPASLLALRWSSEEDLWLPRPLTHDPVTSWTPCAMPLFSIPFSSCKDLVACLVSYPSPLISLTSSQPLPCLGRLVRSRLIKTSSKMVWKFLHTAFLDQWSLHLVVLHLFSSSYAHLGGRQRRKGIFFLLFSCLLSRWIWHPNSKKLRQNVS